MKQPKSKLPWKFSGWFYIIDDNSKPILNITSSPPLLSLEDNNYIIEACNNYPKAVKLLKKFVGIGDLNNQKNLDDMCILDIAVEEFLKEIGENVWAL